MRDRDAYERHGRNNPYAPEQMREHPYDFVSLPDSAAASAAPTHDRYAAETLTGMLRLVYVTRSPLHIGSGVLETAADCGLGDSATPVRGIVRRQGRPILPGSGWKGAVRARYEAITRSRLCLVDESSREPSFKVPRELQGGQGKHQVVIKDPTVTNTLRPSRNVSKVDDLERLSPAEALFGAMGYRGRLSPDDGTIDGPKATRPLQVAPLDGPVMHRLAKPGALRKEGPYKMVISEVEGRKFYYDGPIVDRRFDEFSQTEKYELIDYVPPDSTISIAVHLRSLTLAEVGALLISAGHGTDVGVVRFGGYKPVGLGKVELHSAEARLAGGSSTRQWRRRDPEPFDLERAVQEARRQLVDTAAAAELHQITTRRRPE